MDEESIRRWKVVTKAYCYGARPNATERRKAALWGEAEEFIDTYAEYPVDGWDNDFLLCDEFDEHFSHYADTIYYERYDWFGYLKENPRYFVNHLRAAVRAGVNAAVNEGFGVVGFTIAEVAEMFGGDIPEWLASQYTGLEAADKDAYIVL